MEQLDRLLGSFAFSVDAQGFVFKEHGRWKREGAVGREAAMNFLLMRGASVELATEILTERQFLKVKGFGMSPGSAEFFPDAEGNLYINTYVPPVLQPVKGDYSRIKRILDWLTLEDEAGLTWLLHWMAQKVQAPGCLPKVAVVFSTVQGGGKGTIARLLMHMLGTENCAAITRANLENRFNARWAEKLLVLADEVMTSDNMLDVSDRLKVLIDSETIELEGKGKDQRTVTNRLAWIFASNDVVAPVKLERSDRRYTVFANHEPLTAEYDSLVRAVAHEAQKEQPAAWFKAELSAFYWELLNLAVDTRLVARPYENESRRQLIQANLSGHDQFFDYIAEEGVDELLESVMMMSDWTLSRSRTDWDFGEEGLAFAVLYQCYVAYCKRVNSRALRSNKFAQAIRAYRCKDGGPWEPVKRRVPGSDKRVLVYVVPRRKTVERPLKLVSSAPAENKVVAEETEK